MILAFDLKLFIGIIVIIVLLVVFFVTYVMNKRTPVPEGCEEARMNAQSCSACNNLDCEHHIDIEMIKEEIEKEEAEEK